MELIINGQDIRIYDIFAQIWQSIEFWLAPLIFASGPRTD